MAKRAVRKCNEETLLGWTLRYLDGSEHGLYADEAEARAALTLLPIGEQGDYLVCETWG